MRLVCPNCDAQYDVDDAVIPEGGRDVQCSNCGNTWFQVSAGANMDDEWQAAAETDAQTPPPLAEAEPEPGATPDDDIEIPDEFLQNAEPEAPRTSMRPAAVPKRQVLDDSVTEVLREEAARERRAREAEDRGDVFAGQPDLGLDDSAPAPGRRAADGPEYAANMRGTDPVDAALGSQPGARRDLLPDIEEINYSLRSTSERKEAETHSGAANAPRTRGGFGIGFGLIILLGLAAVAVYLFAPQIIEQVPQAEPYVTPFVEFANTMRAKLQTLSGGLVEQLTALTE